MAGNFLREGLCSWESEIVLTVCPIFRGGARTKFCGAQIRFALPTKYVIRGVFTHFFNFLRHLTPGAYILREFGEFG